MLCLSDSCDVTVTGLAVEDDTPYSFIKVQELCDVARLSLGILLSPPPPPPPPPHTHTAIYSQQH